MEKWKPELPSEKKSQLERLNFSWFGYKTPKKQLNRKQLGIRIGWKGIVALASIALGLIMSLRSKEPDQKQAIKLQ